MLLRRQIIFTQVFSCVNNEWKVIIGHICLMSSVLLWSSHSVPTLALISFGFRSNDKLPFRHQLCNCWCVSEKKSVYWGMSLSTERIRHRRCHINFFSTEGRMRRQQGQTGVLQAFLRERPFLVASGLTLAETRPQEQDGDESLGIKVSPELLFSYIFKMIK